MIRQFAALAAVAAAAVAIARPVMAQTLNKVVGTWRPISATLEVDGVKSHPYGPKPHGMLVFTSDMHFVELLRDPRIPRFESSERGQGTDEENRAAMAGTFALYGSYTVDAAGNFSGNTVEGSNFPNWIGDVRTTKELSMVVEGNRMTENFQRPGGAKVVIVWERVMSARTQPTVPSTIHELGDALRARRTETHRHRRHVAVRDGSLSWSDGSEGPSKILPCSPLFQRR